MAKKALVTGASRGIGKAIAEKLASEGVDLVVTCVKNIDILQDIANDLNSQHNISCEAVLCDGSDPKEVDKLFEKHKDFDIVINNAGISYIGLLQDMSVDDWNKVISTNLSSAFYICRQAIPYMIGRKSGRIINISSMWGGSGASMEVAYSASKGGVDAFTKALAKELAPSGISVNAIACGVIDTDMNRCFNIEERHELEEDIPIGRFGTAEEVARAVWMLVSGPTYMTGQVINMDGGYI